MNIKKIFNYTYNPFKSVIIRRYGNCFIARSANMQHCSIFIAEGAELKIDEGVRITHSSIYVAKGTLHLSANTILQETNITIEDGSVVVADHAMIRAKRFWVRFGGHLNIGSYTNINAGSEIRCDKSISIGSYCQISYNVNIWDTNTHTILNREERRKIAEDTSPVSDMNLFVLLHQML